MIIVRHLSSIFPLLSRQFRPWIHFRLNCHSTIQWYRFFLGHSVIHRRIFSHVAPRSRFYPSLRTLILALDACSSASMCGAVHAQVVKSRYVNEGFVGDRLISCYVKFDWNDDARKLFDEIPLRDLVSWNSLVSGFSRKGCLRECLSAFCRMNIEDEVQPNEVTFISVVSACTDAVAVLEGRSVHGFALKNGHLDSVMISNSLVNMYGKFGALGEACSLFSAMPLANLISWNSMLCIHAQNKVSEKVTCLFNSMRRAGIEPDQSTMVTLLQSCMDIGVAKLVELVHSYILKCGFVSDVLSVTSLLSSYSKSGRLNAAQMVFREIRDPDRVAWTAMMASYAVHGCAIGAVELFEAMVKSGIDPDHVTFTHLLSACSHSGFVDQGKKFFEDMSIIYGIPPRLDHYSCMVDLLGRAGLLSDAFDFIKRMPMEPNPAVWGALLGACRIYKNEKLGKEAANNLFALDPYDHRNYLMLSNIYSASGQWTNASKVRSMMKERNLKGRPGYSLIEYDSKVHRFLVGDRSHPDSDKIYEKLDEVMEKIKKVGFVPQTEFVLHDVHEDVKEDMISKHSEKLAIAFGLLVVREGSPLTIVKNLRICGDCHSMAKFVSLVENRVLIIRDPKRFHHFAGGMCSCFDYW